MMTDDKGHKLLSPGSRKANHTLWSMPQFWPGNVQKIGGIAGKVIWNILIKYEHKET